SSETAKVGSKGVLPSDWASCIRGRRRGRTVGKGEQGPLSANERRTARRAWIAARQVAAPLIPLLLGVAATALLANSGTSPLPRIAGQGSNYSSPPPQKVVVPHNVVAP